MAVCCIHVPKSEMLCPPKKSRKLRCANERPMSASRLAATFRFGSLVGAGCGSFMRRSAPARQFLLSKFEPAAAADPIEPHRQKQVDDFVRDQQPAQHGQRHRGQDFAADALGEHHRKDGDDGHAFGQQLGPQAVDGPFDDRLAQFFQRLDVFQAAALLDRLAQIDQHDDARSRSPCRSRR